jgi:outer membrane protein
MLFLLFIPIYPKKKRRYMLKIKQLTLFCFFGFSFAQAQERMDIKQAIELGLKNNYAITIARNESEIAKNNYTPGNAGFLPQLSLNASGSLSDNNTKQNYSSGLVVNKDGVRSNGFNSGVALNWTIFDGMKMFATYDKLKVLKEMGELEARAEVESTVSKIILAYYEIIRQKQLMKTIEDGMDVYAERVKIANAKLEIGSGNKADLLQAKVDMNEQRSALLKQKTNIANAKAQLNNLLARDIQTTFEVPDSIAIGYDPKYEEVKNNLSKQNVSIQLAQRNSLVAKYTLKEIGSQRYPRIGLNAGYNFTRSENQAGFVLLNQNLGLNTGFTASWLLFNGLNTQRQYRNAKMELVNYELLYANAKYEAETQLLLAYNKLQDAMQVLNLERENEALAKENVAIALERFRLGSSTSIELKEAQKSLLDAGSRLVIARYDAATAETELKRLDGTLMK